MPEPEERKILRPGTVVLDGMGVIFDVGDAGDDVKNLLIPFIKENGGSADEDLIQRTYLLTSEGKMAAFQFWQKVGVDPALEDQYLDRFKLTNGIAEFLDEVKNRGMGVWGLSNDVSEWSRKLRVRFSLDKQVQGFLVSGDVMARKPDAAIFKYLLKLAQCNAEDMLMVDDRPANLNTAAALGYSTALFSPVAGEPEAAGNHPVVRGFEELLRLI
jgi:HAD superfamily hydrolase (TIGR01509 family)